MKHAFLAAALALAAAPAFAQSGNNLEIIHHPNYDKSVFMPFSPAIKVKSGKLLWLAGGTALPVYHDHPHKREQVVQYLTNDLEAQVRAADGRHHADAEGGERLAEGRGARLHLPHASAHGRHRPASAVVNSYFAPYNHKPTTTNMAVLELGEPEQLVEIQVVAVVDD